MGSATRPDQRVSLAPNLLPVHLVNAEATAPLLDSIGGTVFTTGDNTQIAGTAETFRDGDGSARGRYVDRTRPSPGNHDWQFIPVSGSRFSDLGRGTGHPR